MIMLLNAGLLKALRVFSSKTTLVCSFGLLLLTGIATARAQSVFHAVPDRLVQPIDEKARVTLPGMVHPLANRANDRGAVADGMKLDRLQIMLKRSDAQEAELKQVISDMHTPGNESYHKWLTPDEFGKRFGPSDADVAKLSGWLQSHGFNVTKLNAGRQTLEVSGSAGQFRDAFKAQIHAYQVKTASGDSKSGEQLETHYANAANPQIPAALAPVFGGFASLNNFRIKSQMKKLGSASYDPRTHASKPEWTYGTTSDFSLPLAPSDYAVQYSLPSQTTAGTNDGTGQSIAIVNESNINISLVNRFRTLFGLPANPPRVIIDGNDPGIDGVNNPDGQNGASGEAYLDVEWAGALAPAATVNLVIGADTELESGLYLAAERAVYSNISPIISLSFGACEVDLGSYNSFWSGLWEQAAAQGITALVSSGDSGSAGCDDGGQAFAVSGQAVNGFGSTPYNVSVGGTDFYYSAYNQGITAINTQVATYWNVTTPSNNVPVESLKMPVPEQPWNDSQYGFNTLNYFDEFNNTTIAAGSGGASNCALGTENSSGDYTACTAGYPKPAWQTGAGVPSTATDPARDIPDVALFASNGENNSYYPICAVDGDCEPVASDGTVQISGVGGTSASTPSFAGIMALVNQQYGRQGQAGFVLYPLATQFPAAFNDVTIGTNTVPCNTQTVEGADGNIYPPVDCLTVTGGLTGDDSFYGSSTEGEIGVSNTVDYNAGAGYDLASGLGSVNVTNLLADWGKVTFGATAVTLSSSSTTFAHGTAVTISGSVSGTGTPTGDVALITDSTTPLQAGQTLFTLSNGAYSGSVGFLPGGTYNIWGNYGGDNANASSSSIANKVQVTVAPEASTTSLNLYSGFSSTGATATAPSTVAYGTQVLLSGQPAPSSGSTTDSIPTGSVAFTDNGAPLNTAVLNAEGDAEFYSSLAPGSHAIVASYSGDSSYVGSASASTALMVVADTPTFNGPYPTNLNQSQTALLPGQQALVIGVTSADASGNPMKSSNAVAPAGTLTMTGGPAGSTTSVTLVPAVDPYYGNIQHIAGSTEGLGTFVIPASASGTYNLTFTYTPSNPTYYNAINEAIQVDFTVVSSALLTSTTTATATPSASTPTAPVALTATIAGQPGKAAPTGTITIYAADVTFGSFSLTPGTGSSTTETLLFDSQELIQGTTQFIIQYSGDGTYQPSVGTVNVANPLSDFQIVPLTTTIVVPTSGSATDTINLTSTNGFAGAVTFTCAATGGVTCSLNPASATLAAGASSEVSLTVNSTGVTLAGTYNVLVTASDSTGSFIHTLGLQAAVPQVASVSAGGAISVSAPAITVASQGASGTSTVTVTPTGGFTGAVALACAITASPSGATDTPTCALTPPTVSVTSAAAVTTTLTVNTTAQTTSELRMLFSLGGGATMAALFFFGGPIGRRRRLTLKAVKTIRLLSAAALFALIAGAAMGCGSSSNSGSGSGGGNTPTGGTTTGAYTVTITATPVTGSAVTTTVAVTVN